MAYRRYKSKFNKRRTNTFRRRFSRSYGRKRRSFRRKAPTYRIAGGWL